MIYEICITNTKFRLLFQSYCNTRQTLSNPLYAGIISNIDLDPMIRDMSVLIEKAGQQQHQQFHHIPGSENQSGQTNLNNDRENNARSNQHFQNNQDQPGMPSNQVTLYLSSHTCTHNTHTHTYTHTHTRLALYNRYIL